MEAFAGSYSDSSDYAVMERSDRVTVLPFESDWSDLGAWDAVLDQLPSDANGNVVIGDGFIEDSRNTLVGSSGRISRSTSHKKPGTV